MTTYDAESPFDQLVGARERGERPVAPGADLRDANLTGADLQDANLRGADLRWANLTGANLTGANLTGADLRDANLCWANLTEINLRGADLRWAARAARILHLEGLPSGETIFMPTPTGWYLTVGCWEGELEDFKTLIASDEGWPEARGAEVTRRRPSLQAVAALCEAHVGLHPTVIDELAEKWLPPAPIAEL